MAADKSKGGRGRFLRFRKSLLRKVPSRSIRSEDDTAAAEPSQKPRPPANEGRPESETVQFIALEPQWLRRAAITLLVIFTIYSLGIWVFGAIGHFLFLILLAFLIAIAMEPSVRFFERRGLRRGVGTAITMFVGALVTSLVLVMLGGVFSSQLAGLVASLPNIINDVVAWLNDAFGLTLDANTVTSQLNLDASRLAALAGDFAGGIVGALGVAFAIVFDLLTVLVFSFYLAADGPRLRRTVASWLPPAKQKVLITVWDISIAKTGGFVVSKVILASISAVAHCVFFWIIDLPYWLPMGIFAGFASQLIPTIGTYIGVAVPILVGVLVNPVYFAFWIIVFATVYQQIENYVLTPRVSRVTMNIHPAVALASVFIGAAIWGPIGALIGIPIAAAVISVVDTYGNRYELISEMHEGVGFQATAADGVGSTDPKVNKLEHAAMEVGQAQAETRQDAERAPASQDSPRDEA
ncbi:MAG: AI-2E family transporter [Actinomycetia bacterium]|nr:AI-2E family transporter [Actinomycetes bacterium]